MSNTGIDFNLHDHVQSDTATKPASSSKNIALFVNDKAAGAKAYLSPPSAVDVYNILIPVSKNRDSSVD
jgi:hypothetical protein